MSPIDAERATVLLTGSDASYGETDVRGLVRGQLDGVAGEGDIASPAPLAVAAVRAARRTNAG